MRVHVLVLEGAFDLGLSAILDTLAMANDLAPLAGCPAAPFDVAMVGVRRSVHTSRGLQVPVRPARAAPRPHVLLLPALGAKMPEALAAALDRRDAGEAMAVLQQRGAQGVRIGAACTGTFVLAASGLLDGQAATTSWWLAAAFRERFPQVRLDESRMLVHTGSMVTAGAALAHLDLALWLVRQRSPELAALVARYLVLDARGSQAGFVIPDHVAHTDALVERFERWARQRLGRAAPRFSLAEAAQAIGASERTLSRRLRTVLGKSPLGYFQDLRVERAVHLLQTSAASVDQIAARVGYEDGATLRLLLRKRLGRGIRELRRDTAGPA